MPKTSKKPIKRSTRSAKKTNNNKKGLFSKIDFTSRKVQFIAVISLVAILGGGWFTYQSFASNTATYTVNNGIRLSTTTNSNAAPSGTPRCTARSVSDSSKGGTSVAQLSCPNRSRYSQAAAEANYTLGGFGQVNKRFRVCSNLRAAGETTVRANIGFVDQIGNYMTGSQPRVLPRGEYRKVCTEWYHATRPYDARASVTIHTGHNTGSNDFIYGGAVPRAVTAYVGSISVEILADGQNK